MFSANYYKNGTHIKNIPKKYNSLTKLIELFPELQKWYTISRNPNIDMEFIQNNPGYTWYYPCLSVNPNLTMDFVMQNLTNNLGAPIAWDWSSISETIVTEKDLLFYDHKFFHWDGLSQNPNISWEFIKNHPDYAWNPEFVSLNPNIIWETIENNPDYAWDYYSLSKNPNITWEIVQKNPGYAWDYVILYDRLVRWADNAPPECEGDYTSLDEVVWSDFITWEIIKARPDLHWCRRAVSDKKSITWEIIRDNSDFGWDRPTLLMKPWLTWKMIRDYPNIFGDTEHEWQYLASNPFLHDPETFHKLICDRKGLRKFLANFD